MESNELDRVKSLEMLRELQVEHKSIKNNPELKEIQKKVSQNRKKDENLRYKNQTDQDQIQELRQKFQNALNKLNGIDTRDIAFKEAKGIIEKNNSLEGLKIYISSLSEHRKSKNSSTRELEVSLLGYLAEVYKENLVEEVSPLKLLIRIAEIIQTYFKDLNRQVHEAAAHAICSLYKYSLPKSNQQIIFTFMYDPLNSILTTGIDIQVQQAASLTIYIWTTYLVEDKDQGNLLFLYNKVFILFLKLRAEFMDLINALGLMTEHCGFQIVLESSQSFISKLQQYLKNPSPSSQLLKIATCKFLSCLGKHLTTINYTELNPFPNELLNSLRELRTEKLPVLQTSARETLKIWEIYQASLTENPIQLTPVQQNPKILKRIEPGSHFQAIRTLAKLQKEKSKAAANNQNTGKDESIWGLVKPGFLKKGSGNYMVIANQGQVNIAKALEKRPSVIEYIKKQPSPKSSGGILYKENSKILDYERDPSPKLFEVQNESANFAVNPINPVIRRKYVSGEQNNSNVNEKREDKTSEGQNEEKEEEKNVKIIKKYKINEINEEKIGEEDEEEEKNEEFQGFERVNTIGTESKISSQRNSLNSDFFQRSPDRKNLEFTLNEKVQENDLELRRINSDSPYDYWKAKENTEDSKKENLKEKDNKEVDISKNKENQEEIKKDEEKTHNTKDNESQKEETKNKSSKEKELFVVIPKNKVQVMESQAIEIKPVAAYPLKNKKKTRIIPKCTIEKQEPVKIVTNESSEFLSFKNLEGKALNRNNRVDLKMNLSKEIQTSLSRPDTPNFSKEFKSHIFSVDKDIEDDYIEYLQRETEKILSVFEEKFQFISQELENAEERIEWACDTCVCLKRYREVKRKSVRNKQLILDPIKNRKNAEAQVDIIEKRVFSPENPEKIVKRNSQASDLLVDAWTEALHLLDNQDLSEAYETILHTGDDLYLLRLLFKTNPCFTNLSSQTSEVLLSKIAGILHSRFIENLGIQWLSKAVNIGLFDDDEFLDIGLFINGLNNIANKGGEEGGIAEKICKSIVQKHQ